MFWIHSVLGVFTPGAVHHLKMQWNVCYLFVKWKRTIVKGMVWLLHVASPVSFRKENMWRMRIQFDSLQITLCLGKPLWTLRGSSSPDPTELWDFTSFWPFDYKNYWYFLSPKKENTVSKNFKEGLEVIGENINVNCRGEKALWLGSPIGNEETA